MPEKIKELIGNGNIGKALNRAINIYSKNIELHKEILFLKAKFSNLRRGERLGLISNDDANNEFAKISWALIHISEHGLKDYNQPKIKAMKIPGNNINRILLASLILSLIIGFIFSDEIKEFISEKNEATSNTSEEQTVNKNTDEKTIEICSCTGKGEKLINLDFWGPKGEPCCGIPEWGQYLNNCQRVSEIGNCVGDGGVLGTTMWGPLGLDCAGLPGWGKYGDIPVVTFSNKDNIEFCYCKGNKKSEALSGIVLWGPKGAFCGGHRNWGTYEYGCVNE